jgi:hypothetical protein
MDISAQLAKGHGDHLDLAAHIANGSVRIVKTPSGGAKDERGNVLPDDPRTYSIITPENHPHWEDWHDEPHPDSAAEFRYNWDEWQNSPDAQDKMGQIKRSCPLCSRLAVNRPS